MKSLRYPMILLATSSALVLASCSTVPSDFLTAAGDTCQAQRAEMKSVDDYFNQSLITGAATGAATGALAGALAAYLIRHEAEDMVIGATAGFVTGGIGGYFAARSQANQDRNALVQTIYDDATKENIQVNRATATFAALRDCRFAAADAIKRTYRQGTLSQAEAAAQLSRQRELFDQDVIYAGQIGAQMHKRNAEFLNAATELERTEDVVVANREEPPQSSASPTKKAPTPKKVPPAKKSTEAKAPPPSSRVMTVAESGQDSVQAYNGGVEMAKAEGGSKFNLAA